MKKKIYVFVLFINVFLILNVVRAEDFYEAEYFSIYVNKVKENRTYYLTMQAIRDRENNNKMVYCLEPFKFFNDVASYRNINYDNYNLSKEQRDLIRKIAYYGYGYRPKNRMTYEWYAITQVLIWRVVDPSADIYFTTSLNGSRDDLTHQSKIDELWNDVNNNRFDLNINSNYQVIYNNDLEIELNNNYEIVDSNLIYSYENSMLKLNNVRKDGYVIIRERANKEYNGEEVVYDSENAQDLYLPGYLENNTFKINIDVIMGDITLNIFKDKETYSAS